jgi:hypothetical protein
VSTHSANKQRKLVSPKHSSSMLILNIDEKALNSISEIKPADRVNSEGTGEVVRQIHEADRQIDGALSTDDQNQPRAAPTQPPESGASDDGRSPLDNNEASPAVNDRKKGLANAPSEITVQGERAHEVSHKRNHHLKKTRKEKRKEKERAEAAAAQQEQLMLPRGLHSEASSLPTSAIESSADCQPESHEPIAQGDAHYGKFHSRLVFKSEPCAPTRMYFTDDFGYKRMSAMEKFEKWRKKLLRLKDRDLRRNERVVYLIEGALNGPKNEAALWAAKVKSLTNQIQKEMPDSVIILSTSIPASSFLANGLLRPWIDALRAFLQKDPYHFKVELKGDSIMDWDAAEYFQLYRSQNRFDREEVARNMHDREVLSYSQNKAGQLTSRELNDARERLLDFRAQKHEDDLQEAISEIEYARAFITDLQHFQQHRYFPGGAVIPYKSHKPKAKKNSTSRCRKIGNPILIKRHPSMLPKRLAILLPSSLGSPTSAHWSMHKK